MKTPMLAHYHMKAGQMVMVHLKYLYVMEI